MILNVSFELNWQEGKHWFRCYSNVLGYVAVDGRGEPLTAASPSYGAAFQHNGLQPGPLPITATMENKEDRETAIQKHMSRF